MGLSGNKAVGLPRQVLGFDTWLADCHGMN